MFQREEPWPFWKMKTTIPNAAASETRFSRAAAFVCSSAWWTDR